jgi:primosomal protein N'
MTYADLALNLKTGLKKDLFTYSIPAELLPYLTVGSLVEVNFSNRKVLGVIFKLKKRITGIAKDKIKPITKIIDSRPILDKSRLVLSQELSNYYFSSLGKTTFTMFPEPARRAGKKRYLNYLDFSNKSNSTKNFFFQGNFDDRLKAYQKLIGKNTAKGGQTIILTPNINCHKTEQIKKILPKHRLYHSNLTRSQKYQIWQEGKSGKINLLIGTRQALFLPLPKLKLIIAEQSGHELYKSQQEPFIDYIKTAKLLADKIKATLIYGDTAPKLDQYYQIKADRTNFKVLNLAKTKRRRRSLIVDLNKQRGLLSQTLKEALTDLIARNGQALLFLNRTGYHNLAICNNCQQSHYQPASDKNFEVKVCKNCQSNNLRQASLGIKGLAELVRNEFPKTKIAVLSSDRPKINFSNYNIIISTSKILNYNHSFDLVALILPDISVNLPAYNSRQNSFYQLNKILALAKKNIIQTFNPENKFYTYLATQNYSQLYNQILDQNRTDKLPPQFNLFKIYTRQKPYQKNLEEIRQKLVNNIGTKKIEITPIIKPLFFKWPFFLIKSPPKIPAKLTAIFKKLPGGIKIDRDPVDLI